MYYIFDFFRTPSIEETMWHEDLQPIKYETDLFEIDEFIQGIGIDVINRDQRCWIKHSIKMKYRFIVKEARLVIIVVT